MNGMGSVPLYGSSPAIDLIDDEQMQTISEIVDAETVDAESYSFLLIGSVDGRHVIKTLARSQTRSKDVNITSSLSNVECLNLFLDVYGNLKVAEKTKNYIETAANDLTRLVTDQTGPLSNVINFENLRFRERDDLEFVFKYWKDRKPFHIEQFFDQRLRSFYGLRYDSRENVVDWDYNMNLKEQKNGITVPKWGYFSDIVSGPFYSFSVESDNKELFKTGNDIHKHLSQEVAEFNILSYIKVLNPYEELEDDKIKDHKDAKPITKQLPFKPMFKINFLPCDINLNLKKNKRKYIKKYSKIFLSNSLAHNLVHLEELLKDDGKIIVETAKVALEFNTEQKREFIKKLVELGDSSGLKLEKIQGGKLELLNNLVFIKK
ncbi:Dynein assembly factor 3, axonemal [Clydaea vesicula]|uniref:Dynein assembly factor 3, axonemal n=1 Tax=Clydaea vesicula TaxID=447962 RepID=A0AAD5XYN6_9FUNG|nr:Dynein assembly factor 3, axonemal [Clydaea vesicula]